MRIPFSSPAATVSNVIEAASVAESEGFQAIVTGDHVNCSFDRHMNHRMGRGLISEVGCTDEPNFFESLTTLSYLAGKFPTMEFAVGVMLLPIREPVLLAKQIANLDAFSKGRINIGIGIGNATDKEEFRVMRVNYKFDERWEMAREYVEALKELWTKPTASYHGRYVNFDGAVIYPKPAHKPHTPLWVGGHSETAFRLGAEHCNGWMAALVDPEEFAEQSKQFLSYAKEAGRGSENFDLATQARVSIAEFREEAERNLAYVTSGHKAIDHFGHARKDFADNETAVREMNRKGAVGSPSDVLRRLEEFVDRGVNFFDVYFMYPNIGHMVKQLKLFAKEVLPSFS